MRPLTLFTCLLLAVPTATAATAPPSTAPAAPPPAYDQPGPEHARLAALAGKWTSEYRVTPAPGARAMAIPGTAEFRATLGGLWIDADTDLIMGSQHLRGRVTYGYDRFKQRYVFLFLQERDTQPLFGYGVPDAAGTRITFTVPMDVPMVGRSAVPMRTVLDLSKPDTLAFEMNAPLPDGQEYQPVRIDYVRSR